MRGFEKILLIAAVIGLALKFLNVPLSATLLILSLSALSVSYFPLGFIVLAKPDRKSQILLMSILGGLVFSMLVIGLLFKVQHWPFSGFYLMYGTAFGLALMFWIYSKQRSRAGLEPYFKGMMERAVVLVVLAGTFYGIPGRKLLEWQYPHDEARVELLDSLYHHNLDRQTKEALWDRLENMDGNERP